MTQNIPTPALDASERLESKPSLLTVSPKISPVVVIEPPRGWAALNLRELWEYRDLLYFLTWRDIKTRYSQTALGPLWIVLQPLFSMVVYSVIFGGIAKLPTGGIPYPVFSFSGILPWDFFSDSINSGLNSLLINRTVISKVYFPRLHLAFSRVISSLLDLAIATVILFGMILYYNLRPNWTLVFIPLYLGIAMTTGLGFGLLMSGLIVKYRDLGQFVSMFTRAWMYATPVVYSIEAIPEQWRTLYQLNPITNVVIGFRYALLGAGTPPDWKMVLLSAVLGISLFLAGLFAFKRGESNIVDGA